MAVSSQIGFGIKEKARNAPVDDSSTPLFGRKAEYVSLEYGGGNGGQYQFSEDAPSTFQQGDESQLIERTNIYGTSMKLTTNPILEFFDELKPMSVVKYMAS